jgi:phosphoribosylaminoimidazole-succinocarboxamide synthase
MGLRIGDRLPEPIFTPAAKVDDGHDVNVTRREVASMYGRKLADRLELLSLNLYQAASELAEERHLILADTKFEFGFIDGELTLIDELLTPDSSRYWDATRWKPGHNPPSFDKQFVRDWLATSGWDKQPPAPELPAAVVAGTLDRYGEAYRRLTGSEPALRPTGAQAVGVETRE